MSEAEEIKSRVNEMTSINFSITKCPQKVFRRFSEFCKTETNNNYSFALKLLLDGMEGNVKEALLFQQYIELKAELDELKVLVMNISTKSEPEKKKRKTFGKAPEKKVE